MGVTPKAELLHLPDEYGTPSNVLDWPAVARDLEAAERYWLTTTRPDGRPHAVPVDALWMDDALYFGGSTQTVHHRNLARNPRAVVHLEDALAATIVEGSASWQTPTHQLAVRLADASAAKYGYAPSPDAYEASGLWVLRPHIVLAWRNLPTDATRFTFG